MICLALPALTACKENEIMDFGLPGSVNFNEFTTVNGVERFYWSKSYSFAIQNSDLTEVIVPINVKLMGSIADHDRTFRAKAVAENTTAVEGTHYRILEGVIKAGEYEGYLPVEIYRTADTREQSVTLQLVLTDEGDLKAGNGSEAYPQAEEALDPSNRLKFTLEWGDILLQPANWPLWYWGPYYANKYRFAIDVLGTTDWPAYGNRETEYREGFYTPAQLQNLGSKLNDAYQVHKADGGDPIYNDENSTTEIYFGV